jgi:hypothetical protein
MGTVTLERTSRGWLLYGFYDHILLSDTEMLILRKLVEDHDTELQLVAKAVNDAEERLIEGG